MHLLVSPKRSGRNTPDRSRHVASRKRRLSSNDKANRLMSFSDAVSQKQRSRGLPGEPLYDTTLLFNDISETLVFACSIRRERVTFPQLYFRSVRSRQYTSVADLAKQTFNWTGDIGIEYPFACQKSRLVCLASEYDLSWPEAGAPIKSLGILRINLEQQTCEHWDARDGITTAWILQRILGCSGDGDEILALVGFPEAQLDGYQIVYSVARLSWRTRRVDRLHVLEDVFY